MSLNEKLHNSVRDAIESLYGSTPDDKLIQLQKTRKEIEGDATLVVFPLLRLSRKSPEDTAADLGDYLAKNVDEVIGYNIMKGFLNLGITMVVVVNCALLFQPIWQTTTL